MHLSILRRAVVLLCLAGFLGLQHASAQHSVKPVNYGIVQGQERPIPYPVIPSPQLDQAVKRGTRTRSGQPGPNYWMNKATYRMEAQLSPGSRMLRAHGTITYVNNSPDTLKQLVVQLRQNFYKEGVVRNRPTGVTGGLHISEVALDGQPLLEQGRRSPSGYRIRGALMYVYPQQPLAPGDTARLHAAWNFKVPKAGGYRMGQDGEAFYLGYWYPQMAAYDDLNGWFDQPYMGDGEFYMDYADYQVSITVPQGWLVTATGALQNRDEVLTPAVQKRLELAAQSDTTVHIVNPAERKPGYSTRKSGDGTLTWRFSAHQVRDFAFGTSADYAWDATSAQTGDGTTLIYAFYRPEHRYWDRAAEFARFTIEDMSRRFMPYPWPHMSIVEGIIGGGMEYPMLTLIGSYGSYRRVFGTIYHETGHMWFPMQVDSNEKRYAWMDEGLTTYNTAEGEAAFWPDYQAWQPGESYYYRLAGSGREVPPMRHADRYPVHGPARVLASYTKPGLALHALEGIMGTEDFRKAYRSYARSWQFKHPSPYDLFNRFERVYGKDLDWFWTSMFYTDWTLDQAIASVNSNDEGVTVTVKDLGLTPMPVFLRVTYEDGNVVNKRISVDEWLKGKRTVSAAFEAGTPARVEIDPDHWLPDVDLSNNVWTAE